MLVWGFCLLVWCAVSLFPGGRHRKWTCWTAYWSMLSFDTPRRECARHCTIRSKGTNTVLRPGKSRERRRTEKKENSSKTRVKFLQCSNTIWCDCISSIVSTPCSFNQVFRDRGPHLAWTNFFDEYTAICTVQFEWRSLQGRS